jgi:membrane protein implicated in regulation of membrane protease activity
MPPVQETRPESAFDPWEVIDLLGGFAVVAMPLFLLAVPAVVLLMPLAIVGLALALVLAPPIAVALGIRALRRRSRRRRAPTSRPGDVPRQPVMRTMQPGHL